MFLLIIQNEGVFLSFIISSDDELVFKFGMQFGDQLKIS